MKSTPSQKMKAKAKQRPQLAKKPAVRTQIRPPIQAGPKCSIYEENFKRAVVQYAEQKSITEAKKRYGVSVSNIKRWRRLKREAEQHQQQQIRPAPAAGPPRKPEPSKKAEQKVAVLEVKLTRSKKLSKTGSEDIGSTLDAMPLEKRLRAPTPTASTSAAPPQPEPVLQSQPLSPTKLKVTRQAARPGSTAQQSPRPTPPPPTPPPPPPPPQDVCLRWNTHHANMQTTFPSLLMKEQYVDATLVAEGQTIKCHRVILSSCSPYFEDVLSSISPYQHPVLFMKDIPFWILRSVCDFMYAGEVNVAQNKLEEFLAVADNLKIKGLARTIDFPPIQEVKKEPDMKPIKEEQKEEKREEKEKEIKDLKESKETVKEIKDKKDKELKEKEKKEKEAKEKEKKEREVKEKEKEILQTKQRVKKRHHLPIPAAEMPVLKSAKLLRSTPQSRQTLEMPVLKTVLKPSKTKAAFVAKKSDKVEKKLDKSEKKVDKPEKKIEKPEKTVTFAPQKPAKESPSTSKIFDPMNLLKPVYAEVTKEKKTQSSPVKMKEPKQIPVKKTVQKKIKKRKISEEREESPPPVLSRKGTRSRPNRKMAKFYHSPYERNSKRLKPLSESSTIVVREPHTSQQPEPHQETQTEHQDQPMESQMDQADPLMQMEIIKDEPVDMEENAIDIVENVVSYGMQMHEEEIMGNYDIKSMSKSMKIVNVADIKGIEVVDPLTFNQDPSNISITNIHSLMEKDDSSANQLGFKISSVMSTAEASKEKSTEQNCKEMGFKIGSVVSDPPADFVPKVEVESTGTLTEESQDSISDAVGEKTSENGSSVSEALRDIKRDIQQQSNRQTRHAEENLNDEERLLAEDQLDESRLLSETISEAAEQTLLEDDSAQLEIGRVPKIEACDSTEEEETPRVEDTDDETEEFEQNMPTTPQGEGSQLQIQKNYSGRDMREANVASCQEIAASDLKNISQFIKKEKEESQELSVETEIGPDVSYEQVEEEKGDSQDLTTGEIAEPGQPYSGDNVVVSEYNARISEEPAKLQPDEQADIEVSKEFGETDPKLVDISESGNVYHQPETTVSKEAEEHREVIQKLTDENYKDTVEENNEVSQDGTGEEITEPTQLENEDVGSRENLATILNKPEETIDKNDEVSQGVIGKDILMDTVPTQLGTEDEEPDENLTAVPNKPKETLDEEDGFLEDVADPSSEKRDDQLIEGMALKPDGIEALDARLECSENLAGTELDKQEDVTTETEIEDIKSQDIPEQPFEIIDTKHDEQSLEGVDGSPLDKQVGQYMTEPELNDFTDPYKSIDPEMTENNEIGILNAPQLQKENEMFTAIRSEHSNEEYKPVVTEDGSKESSVSHATETDFANSSSQPDQQTDSKYLAVSQQSDFKDTAGDVSGSPITFDQETEAKTTVGLENEATTALCQESEATTALAQETEATFTGRIEEESERSDDVSTKSNQMFKDESNVGEFFDEQGIGKVSDLSDQSLQNVASLNTEGDKRTLEEKEITEEILDLPYQETDPVVSNNQEPMKAEQIGDLLSMNIERLSVEDQVMAQVQDVQCPMDIPSDIIDDSTETPIGIPSEVLENLEDDKEPVLPPMSDDVPSTKEGVISGIAHEIGIGDTVPNVIPDDTDNTIKAEDLLSDNTAVKPPDPTQDLTQSSDVQPLMVQTDCSSEISHVRTEASEQVVCDTSEDFNVPRSVQSPEQDADPVSTVLNTSQDVEISTQYTRYSSETLNFPDDTGTSVRHSALYPSEGEVIPRITDSSSSSFDIVNKEGCDAEGRAETEEFDVNTVQQGEVGRLSPTALSEPEKSETASTSVSEQNVPQSIDFNAPGFHIAQVVNQQFALNEEYRSCPAEQRSEDVVQGSSDLESIVNDLTMIVGEDRSQPAGSSEVRGEDDTNVIAESLENLLEK